MPYTTALASAIHSAAPHLSSLEIASDLCEPEPLAAATPGLCRLITTCGPSLTSLTFSRHLHYSIPQPLDHAIATCTRLQHLQLSLIDVCWCDEDGKVCEPEYQQELQSMQHLDQAMSALPALRSLDFERHNLAVPVEFGVSRLTHLTNLRFNGLDLALMENITALVLSPLSHLVRLTLHGDDELCEADFRLLAAACSQLTCLAFDGMVRLDLKGAGRGGRRWGCVPLPVALRELHIHNGVRPYALLALELPPGLTRLVADGLSASCSTTVGYNGGAAAGAPAARVDGHGSPAAGAGGADGSSAAALPPTSGGTLQQPSPCPGFDDLLEAVRLLHERGGGECEELTLWHDWDPSPLTWPVSGDGHVRRHGTCGAPTEAGGGLRSTHRSV